MGTTTRESSSGVFVERRQKVKSSFDHDLRKRSACGVWAGSVAPPATPGMPSSVSSVLPSATQNMLTTAGASVTISGLNFVSSSKTPTVMISSSEQPFGTTSWTSATTVQAISVDAKLLGTRQQQLLMQMTSFSGTSLAMFTFDSPVVSFGSPYNIVSTGGGVVTMSGLTHMSTYMPTHVPNTHVNTQHTCQADMPDTHVNAHANTRANTHANTHVCMSRHTCQHTG